MQGRRIVVLIDDVDRLQSAEIRELMRLVKLVADLPGVVYVLAYERRRVERALSAPGEDDGREYLEKIIQAPFALQPPRHSRVLNLALDWLDEAVGDKWTAWSKSEWSSLWHDGVEHYIETLRDAERVANVVPAAVWLTAGEVASMDVVALEIMRLFDPEVHEALPRIAPILTASRRFEIRSREELRRADQATIDEVLAQSTNRDAASHMLRVLFPSAGHLFGSSPYVGAEEAWRSAKRVASRRILDRYLHASLAEGEVPSAAVTEFAEALADASRLEELVTRLSPDALADVLDRVRPEVNADAVEDPVAVGAVLVGLADRTPRERTPLSVDNGQRAIWLLEEIVAALPSRERRQEVVAALIDNAPTLKTRRRLLYAFRSSPDGPSGNPRSDILSVEQTREAHERIAAEVLAMAPQHLANDDVVGLLAEVAEHYPDGREKAIEMLASDEVAATALAQTLTMVIGPAGEDYRLQTNGLLAELLGREGVRALAERLRPLAPDNSDLATAIDAAMNDRYIG